MGALEDNNLKRLEKTELVSDFVLTNNGEWDHRAWLNFCEGIRDQGYCPIDLDQVGLLLERKKSEFWAKKSAK
jgi:hypothetical protein